MANPNTDSDERVDPELDALSWNPTAEEADAYLRGHGIIKKCEHCGQDATLTNDFVSHLLARFGERMREADNAATRMRDRCVEKLKSIAADYRRLHKDNANIIAHHLDGAANQLQSLEGEQEKR